MLKVPFIVKNQTTTNQNIERVCFSIPLSKSTIYSTAELSLYQNNDTQLNANFTPLVYWPDGSIKWCQCEFIHPTDANSTETSYYISHSVELTSPQKVSSLIENDTHFSIHCPQHTFLLNKKTMGLACKQWHFECIDEQSQPLKQNVLGTKVTKANDFSQEIIQSGQLLNESDEIKLDFDCKYTFLPQQAAVSVAITLRNSKAMFHHDGKWDLGNEHSFKFQACNIQFTAKKKQIQLSSTQVWQPFLNNQTLLQASSGGENWQSSNHMNAERKVTLPFQGYQLTQNQAVITEGKRAQPCIHVDEQYFLSLENFWQNFPKSISTEDEKAILGLFPQQAEELHELQPGEQKTHRFFMALNEETIQNLLQPAQVAICPKYMASTKALPFFSAIEQPNKIDQIIGFGLNHTNNFFEKREQMDEYGWRNFGDLYADHETLEYQGNAELISHYNNQYDPLYGFIRQALITQNNQWWTLATDLAQHVKDIDIYHTNDDKIEYNHGLFWHTDHYLPAETASHRTYSKHQDANAYQDHAGGGGPGGQHCYTTGLMLHYCLTGESSSKQAVVNLAEWITNVYEGSGTFLDSLLKIKNQHFPGQKNIVTGQYPLDRGTGNYIIALIDAYEVTGKQSYLNQASLVIKNTANPEEDLANRDLGNIEASWFYTVFLQAVGRYLETKHILEQFDESFKYAQLLLLHFAKWMLAHEQPYLKTPDVLEYPNHTWAAQDIRKANVLYLSAYFESDNQQAAAYQEKADEIYQYVADELLSEETHYYTRILSILMQNHGIKQYVEENSFTLPTEINNNIQVPKIIAPTKQQIIKVLGKSLISTSLNKELSWLRLRSKKINDLLLKVGIK